VEKAKSTETEQGARGAARGLKWMTPQGEKTIRAGDHQAVQTMYVVRITNGQFQRSAARSKGRRTPSGPNTLHAVLSVRGGHNAREPPAMTEVLDYIEFVLAPQVVTGLAFGVAVYFWWRSGLTIIFGLLDVINMVPWRVLRVRGVRRASRLGWLGIPFWAAAGPGAARDAAGGPMPFERVSDPARVQTARTVTSTTAVADLWPRARASRMPFRLGFGPNPYRPGKRRFPARSSCSGIFLPNYPPVPDRGRRES